MSPPPQVPLAAAETERGLIRPTWGRRVKWRVETIGYVTFEAMLGCLPIVWVARIGRGLGGLAHGGLIRRRRTVARNLRIALAGEKNAAEQAAMNREVFCRAGANLLCALRTARMGERSLGRVLTLRDETVYREALAAGKGVVFVLAHMGNWEALAQWFPRLLPPGVAGATVYRPLNNPILNARLVKARAQRGIRLFSKDDNPLGMAGFLRHGGVLGVLSDQRAGKTGEIVPFFGRNSSCSPIPAILARRTGAALVGLSLETVAPGRWVMRFHAAEPGEPTTAGVMKLVERMMRVSLTDVFWLQDRWRVTSYRPAFVAGKVARGGAPEATKRRRVLLWPRATGEAPQAPPSNVDDIDYILLARRADETPDEALLRMDAAADLPLEYVVSAESETDARAACRRNGIVWVKEAGA